MIRKWPLIPTILVAAAVATMIGLGIWQLQRRQEKLALLDRYAAAQRQPPITWPTAPFGGPLPLFRAATGHCLSVTGFRTGAGQNRTGDPGFLVIAECRVGAEGPGMPVELGWSKNPNAGHDYKGGLVSGIIAPDSKSRMRLVAAEPGPGLMASAPPSLDSIPNNHLSYAVQWFAFAAAAALIYVLALKQREARQRREPEVKKLG
jgi:surfeit locus 1 family protein